METFQLFIIELCAALFIDAAIGDPHGWRWHPVRGLGSLISGLERALYGDGSFERGAVLALLAAAISGGAVHAALMLLAPVPLLRAAGEIFLLYSAIAWRSLKDESRLVEERLAGPIAGAREAVARIVGRDTDELTPSEITRAAIETVGENMIDGVISPIFFALAGAAFGVPCEAVWVFKAISTLDSTVGYKNERYRHFGTASARLDDALNFIPARLGAIAAVAAGVINGWTPFGASEGAGVSAADIASGVARDRLNHSSPNSAHGEAAMAWLLGIELGGPAKYGGVLSDKPRLGVPRRDAEPQDISRSHRVLDATAALFTLAGCAVLLSLAAFGII